MALDSDDFMCFKGNEQCESLLKYTQNAARSKYGVE